MPYFPGECAVGYKQIRQMGKENKQKKILARIKKKQKLLAKKYINK